MQRGRLTAVARCGALLSESAGVSLRLLISPQRRPIKSQLRASARWINGWPQRRAKHPSAQRITPPLDPCRPLNLLDRAAFNSITLNRMGRDTRKKNVIFTHITQAIALAVECIL